MPTESEALVLGKAQGAPRYFLQGRPVSGGDVVELCCSGGWVAGRFEWDTGVGAPPTFYFSIELAGGRVAAHSLVLPEGALLRWPPKLER